MQKKSHFLSMFAAEVIEQEFPDLAANLLPVTLGNIVGGVVFVSFACWYMHNDPSRKS